MDNRLSSREKGDIYWRKRIMYIASAEKKSGLREGFLNRDTADDTLDVYDDYVPEMISPFPTGREFYVCPPTAAGQRYFAESVSTLMHTRNYIMDILSADGAGMDEQVRSIFFDSLGVTLDLINSVIDDFFAISGIDSDGHELAEKPDRKQALENFKKSRAAYEAKIGQIFDISSENMIEKLRAQVGVETSGSSQTPLKDEAFEILAESDPASAMLYEDALYKLRQTIGSTLQEATDRVHLRDTLKQALLDRYYTDDVDPVVRHIITDAFMNYRHLIDNELIRLLYTRQACYYFARCLITDEPVDSIIAEKIREDLNEEVDIYDEGMMLNEIPGFIVVEEEASHDEKIPDDLESIMESGKVLRAYYNLNPGVFDAQCLLSVVTDNDELGSIVHRARLLSKGIDDFTKSGAAYGAGTDTWFMLFDTWAVAYTICRVAFPIMDFLKENENATIGEATEKLEALLPSISYTALEKHSREVLRDIILQRSGKGDLYK